MYTKYIKNNYSINEVKTYIINRINFLNSGFYETNRR